MMVTFFVNVGVLFFLLVPIGIYSNSFLLYGTGLTGAGVLFILHSILIRKDWKGFKKYNSPMFFWTYRLSMLGFGILALYGSSAFWLDLPAYLRKNFSQLQGIPSIIDYEERSNGKKEGDIVVTINGKKLTLNPTPKYSVSQMQGHLFKITYLPNTEWIINYKIEGLEKE